MATTIPRLEDIEKLPDDKKREMVDCIDSLPDECWTLPPCKRHETPASQKKRKNNSPIKKLMKTTEQKKELLSELESHKLDIQNAIHETEKKEDKKILKKMLNTTLDAIATLKADLR